MLLLISAFHVPTKTLCAVAVAVAVTVAVTVTVTVRAILHGAAGGTLSPGWLTAPTVGLRLVPTVWSTSGMGLVQELMAAARSYRTDPEQRQTFVETIDAATNYDHLSLTQVAEVTGYSEQELEALLAG
jgi:hypothetical protein